MAVGDTDGFVKVVRHRETGQLLGVHMIGHNVTECIAAAGALLHQKVSVADVAEVGVRASDDQRGDQGIGRGCAAGGAAPAAAESDARGGSDVKPRRRKGSEVRLIRSGCFGKKRILLLVHRWQLVLKLRCGAYSDLGTVEELCAAAAQGAEAREPAEGEHPYPPAAEFLGVRERSAGGGSGRRSRM